MLCGRGFVREANLLITDTGASNPKYIVGVSSSPAEDSAAHGGNEARLRADVAASLAVADPNERLRGDAASSTFTAELFAGMRLDRVAQLGHEEHWRIRESEVCVPLPVCILGRGSFGVVSAAMLHGQAVAVKTLPRGAEDESRVAALLNELRVLRRVRHPNVVLFFGCLVEPGMGSIALVYDLIRGLQLDQAVVRLQPSRLSRFRIIYDISSALRYLHSQDPPIVHGDLKGSNVMVEELRSGFRAKVIDFGLSRFLTRGVVVHGGSLGWSPPERFLFAEGGARSTSADMYPFGWLVHLALSGEGPHGGVLGEPLKNAMVEVVTGRQAPTLNLPEATPWRADCESLCRACLAFEPTSRPTMRATQATLRGWLSAEDVLQLDFGLATTTMRCVCWKEGEHELREPAELRPSVQLDLDVRDNCRVVHREDLDGPAASPLPAEGESLLDWVASPESLRTCIASTLNDIRTGIAVAPMMRRFGGIELRNPSSKGQCRPCSNASGCVFFPEGSDVVSLRLCMPGLEGDRQIAKCSL